VADMKAPCENDFMRFFALLLALACAGCSRPAAAPDPAAADILGVAGTRTRAVWVQGDETDERMSDELALVGYDTEDGRGERRILPELGSYRKPMFTAGGDRIVFSRRPTRPEGPEVLVVNWDGTGLRSVTKGYGLFVWQDPADGRDWVYVGSDSTPEAWLDFANVTRVLLDDPGTRELVWNKTRVSSDTFTVSADGREVMANFPWPHAGIATLPNGTFRRLGRGCWTSLTRVRGPLAWVFDGPHRNLTLFDIRSDRKWTVNISAVPASGFQNAEVYHPKWTNHPRFMTMTGPYNLGGRNQVRTGGRQSEVWLGRFKEDYSAVEAWAQVSRNAFADAYPDVWVDRRKSPFGTTPDGPIGPPPSAAATGGSTGSVAARVTVNARLVRSGAIPTPQSIAPYRHALVVSLYDVVNVVNGEIKDRQVLVARWAIRDARVLPEARQTPGEAYRLVLERFDAHPELEGERLILLTGAPDLPLMLDVPPS
jgi:hypothetical protein